MKNIKEVLVLNGVPHHKELKKHGSSSPVCFRILTFTVTLDTERLCETLWKHLKLPNKWVMHSCQLKGCKKGYVTVDRNEILKRPKCAARKHLSILPNLCIVAILRDVKKGV